MSREMAALYHAVGKRIMEKGKGNVGGLSVTRKDGLTPYGESFMYLLIRNGGTIKWDMDDPNNGLSHFDNCFQYIAAEIYAEGARQRDRVEASQDYENAARSGCNTAADHLDRVNGLPLYRCTTPGSGNKITVITMFPDYVIDEDTGLTAAEAQYNRDKRAAEGHISSFIHRRGRYIGEAKAKNEMREIVEKEIGKSLPSPAVSSFEKLK